MSAEKQNDNAAAPEQANCAVPTGSAFVVTAYRWGQRNAHSYVVGAFADLESAKKCAEGHMDYRGGKYGCEVCDATAWAEDSKDAAPQVYYVESPYYGVAGDAGHFHPADVKKDGVRGRGPLTVRELQNRIWELERQLSQNNPVSNAVSGTAKQNGPSNGVAL